jgi:Tfp pilus assembly protein PilV
VTLIEAIIAVGVLAVAVPLVLGTIAEGGKSGMAAEAETCAVWMLADCMAEIQASRNGVSRYFPATTLGQTFPPVGDVWALAFYPDGTLAGQLSKSLHDSGTKELGGKPIRFIAVLEASAQTITPDRTPMLKTRISIQYPSSAPVAKRGQLDFYTLIP